jgi:AbrB family looped-hinge helix DNA binding protein
MTKVTLSPKYQIVIPKEIREQVNLKPGQEIEVMLIGRSIHLVPVVPIEELRGFLVGIGSDVPREEDRKF